MRKVFDLECNMPPDEDGNPREYATMDHPPGFGDPERLPPLEGHGFENYRNIFTSGATAKKDKAEKGMGLDAFVASLDAAGVVVGVVGRMPNDRIADLLARYPGRFIGLATISPHDGMRGVRELERLVRDHGLGGLRVASLYNMIPASDRRYYPHYAKCVELDIPARIYTAMNYANDRPYDLGHPRHLDQVAMDFPELRVIAGLSGWPWVADMVGLLRRHPNLHCDTAAHRPRTLAIKGSGWEQFMQFGNSLFQDKVMVGLSVGSIGIPAGEAIAEYEALPLKASVIDKWLYGNAARFFGRA
jgi:predicted TIM-barrel fold metal-dependent hydrolase